VYLFNINTVTAFRYTPCAPKKERLHGLAISPLYEAKAKNWKMGRVQSQFAKSLFAERERSSTFAAPLDSR